MWLGVSKGMLHVAGVSKGMLHVAGGKQGHAPCRILSLQQSFLLCQLNFMEIIGLSQRERETPMFKIW